VSRLYEFHLLAGVFVNENDHVKKGRCWHSLTFLCSTTSRQVEVNAGHRASEGAASPHRHRGDVRPNPQHLHALSRLSGGKVPSQTGMEAGEAKLARAIADEARASAARSSPA
jgi:hypothetical protein